jgi:hypothetical protein
MSSTQNVAASAESSSTVAEAQAVSTDAVTQAGAAQSNHDQASMSDTINSLSELKEKAPEVYNQMMLGIATNICSNMQHQQERLKQAIRQGQSS